MGHVRDHWYKNGPNGRKVKSDRYGSGKRWVAIWDEDGTRQSKSFTTRDAAEGFLSKTWVEQDDGTYVPRANREVTVADVWLTWIGTKSATSKSTRDGYAAAWSHIERRWGNTPCREVSRSDVAAWLPTLRSRYRVGDQPKPLGASSSRKVMLTFHGILDTAVEERIIVANPLKLKDAPRQKLSERRYLSVPELDRLRESMPDAATRLVVDVLVMTGVRPGEAFGLRAGDLDPTRGRIRVSRDVDARGEVDETKTGRHRDVPCGGDLLADLEDAADGRERGAPLLLAADGRPWTRDRWRPVWSNARETAGLDELDTYELRHTAASLAIHSGANVKTVQRMLGHSSAAITLDVYGHIWDSELDALPAAMDAHMRAERDRFRERRERARAMRRSA